MQNHIVFHEFVGSPVGNGRGEAKRRRQYTNLQLHVVPHNSKSIECEVFASCHHRFISMHSTPKIHCRCWIVYCIDIELFENKTIAEAITAKIDGKSFFRSRSSWQSLSAYPRDPQCLAYHQNWNFWLSFKTWIGFVAVTNRKNIDDAHTQQNNFLRQATVLMGKATHKKSRKRLRKFVYCRYSKTCQRFWRAKPHHSNAQWTCICVESSSLICVC